MTLKDVEALEHDVMAQQIQMKIDEQVDFHKLTRGGKIKHIVTGQHNLQRQRKADHDSESSIALRDIKQIAAEKYSTEHPENPTGKQVKELPQKEHDQGHLERFLENHPNASQVEQTLLIKLPEINKTVLKQLAQASKEPDHDHFFQ